MEIYFEIEDLSTIFDTNYLARGINYANRGMVISSQDIDEQDKITAIVQGSNRKQYHCIISVNYAARTIVGECSCPIGFNCKHVVAVIVDHINLQHKWSRNIAVSQQAKSPPTQATIAVDNWLHSVAKETAPKQTKKAQYELHFVFQIATNLSVGRHIRVDAIKTKKLKNGSWGVGTKLTAGSNSQAAFLTDKDIDLLRLIEAVDANPYGMEYSLMGTSLSYILERLAATDRSHWQDLNTPAIQLGKSRQGKLDWQLLGAHVQVTALNQEDLVLLPTEPLMYFDLDTHEIGMLVTGLSNDVALLLATAPEIAVDQCPRVKMQLEQSFPDDDIAVPTIEINELRTDIKPVPFLRLFSEKDQVYYPYMADDYDDYADLHFEYNGIKTSPLAAETILNEHVDGHIEQTKRQFELEKKWIQSLRDRGLELEDITEQPQDHLRFYHVDEDQGWMVFSASAVAELREAGWQITFDPTFRFDIIDAQQWYVDLDDSSGEDWFNLELGVKIAGETISLLPVIVNYIQQKTRAKVLQQLLESVDDRFIFITLEDGRVIRIGLGKVRHIIETLVELYDPNALDNEGKLKLSRYQAGQLNDLAEGELQWAGAKAPRLFAEKLSGFKKISKIKPPKTLKADLRPYQQQGLDWLQFLREYGLSGILADEMGLGKTVQTLAHILIEKQAGRIEQPCLVVATTSLMVNWANEIKRFAPSLSFLVSQGDQRKQHFDTFSEYDIILTTYPLLPRDSDVLCQQQWHIVILDEAQYIKNPRSKVADIARQLKANHRLCLTGTPMENHLGELWSQFHFLMPGFLGDEKQFRTLFRKPIENQEDHARQQKLNNRIAPFLLRREKSKVAKELPEKTEIISAVELSGQQRQLYETIRVAMNEKVRKEIDKKGLARSQIIILDALLKLRQVCCDPRLLKLDSAQQVKNSAKLEQLMEILPEMVIEGRRILLFSQFTSMLSLIEQELDKRAIAYVKLTGKTKDRATPINMFQNKDVSLFLISLKAGGAGLNLTAADTVIHYDPWWNPAVESQATDRAHRIGQKNKVFVYKMIVTGTVEEKINVLQQKKKALADALFGNTKQTSTLTEKDLQALFEPLA